MAAGGASGLPVGVAAGHPDTARVGADVLRAGGSAADAAVAMMLAGCAAETIFTGLGGGGFATVYDASDRSVVGLDFFVAVPGLDGTVPAPAQEIDIRFGEVPVAYAIGGPSVAVPGTPAGAAELHRRFGRLPWPEVVGPARELATAGAPFSRAHADLLPDLAAALLLDAGAPAYTRPDGATPGKAVATYEGRPLLTEGDLLRHPGLDDALQLLEDEGPKGFYHGDLGRDLVRAVRADGGAMSQTDLEAYRVTELTPRRQRFGSDTITVRGNDLDHFAVTAGALDLDAVRRGPASRALALIAALRAPARRSETTSLVAVDERGDACAVTHSLGLGSGVWVSGVHGNSMLGEGELLRGDLVPGERMPSMMVPLVVTDEAGALRLAGGAAGGSRIRSGLLQAITGVLVEGLGAQEAVDAPRLAVVDGTVHLEPGFDEAVYAAVTAAGESVVRWPQPRPYFGGVALAAADGPAADPRRGGASVLVR